MELTSKERLLLAIKNQIPDHVPVTPDFSNMIPCRLTGKPFWDIYLYHSPDLYFAYAKAVEHFGIDGWFQAYDAVKFKRKTTIDVEREIVSRTKDRIVEKFCYYTTKGNLYEQMIYFIDNPPTKTEKMIKDIKEDFLKIKELYSEITGYDDSKVGDYRKVCGDRGIFCLNLSYPGMQYWHEYFVGNAVEAIYAYYDYPEIFEEWAYLVDRDMFRMAEIQISLKPDVLMLGGSGTLTLASPELVRKFAIPTIRKITKMAKEAGIPTMLHSCGKSMAFLDMLANETDLRCINPLEEPPMGDCLLKEVKKKYGHKLSLMGNLHTSNVMLIGTTDDVEMAAKRAIDDAGANGGFILSTGDQCGRDTPDENIFKLVEVAKTYGRY